MSIVNKLRTSIREQRQQEDNNASIAALQANLDYIAMMADIELEDDTDADTASTEESEE